MKKQTLSSINDTKLLELFVKSEVLTDFFTAAWCRWSGLCENAEKSVELLEDIKSRNKEEDTCEDSILSNFIEYYTNAQNELSEKTDTLLKQIKRAENRKKIIFAEICRRNLASSISTFREIIKERVRYYNAFVEDDL